VRRAARDRCRRAPSGERGVALIELAVTMAIFGMIMAAVMLVWSAAQQAYFVGAEAAEHQQSLRAAIDFMAREIGATGRDATGCAFDYQGPASRDCTKAKADHCRLIRNLQSLGYTAEGCRSVFAMPVAQVTETSLQIRSDRNDSGTVVGTANASAADEGAENVRYALGTGSRCPAGVKACLTRDDGAGPMALVAVDIAGLKLTYYPRPGFPPCDGGPPQQPCPAFGLPLAGQRQADNIGRIRIEVTSRITLGGKPVTRKLETDVVLRNR
jgi:prepilin-type N-terminal cleavage/methylation domain-containing protein